MPTHAAKQTVSFSIRDTVGIATYPSGSSFGPRTLTDHEFVWIVAGSATWHVDGRDHALAEGCLALGRPGMRDGFTWDPRRPTRHGFIHVGIVRPPPGLPPAQDWPLVRVLPANDALRPLFALYQRLTTARPPGWRELASDAMATALRAFVLGELAGGEPAEEAFPPPIDAMLELVREAWAGGDCVPIALDDLARAAGVGRVQLCRLCQRTFAMSPVELVRRLRVHRAAELLARTAMDVGAVARATGFASPFHCSRVFREVHGLSPTAFRQRMLAGGAVPVIPLVRVRRAWAAVIH